MKVTLREIAEFVQADFSFEYGDEIITDVQKIENATSTEISFIANPKYAKFALTTSAKALLVPKDFPDFEDNRMFPLLLRCEDSYRAFQQLLNHYYPQPAIPFGEVHPTAVIDPTAIISETAYIGAHVTIGAQCEIGEHVALFPGVVLYERTEIGAYSVLHANVVCYDRTQIGSHCLIHAGTVIGSDGFGFAEQPDGSWEKIPQIGSVVINDNVEIGANCTIDRATIGKTVIESGVKVDNLVQIAHNVEIGQDSAIAAQAGISGSAKIGKRNKIGGQAGITGHLTIADGTTIVPQSGVSKTLTEPVRYIGSPAKPFMEFVREEAAVRQLPELLKEFRELQREFKNFIKEQQ